MSNGRLTEAIQNNLDALPGELEKLVTEGDLDEAKRVSTTLQKRVARRELRENPAAIAQAIVRLKTGK